MTQEPIDFRQLGEDSSELIVAFDAQFRYIYVNPPVEQLLDTPREQMLGRTLWEFAPAVVDTVYTAQYKRAMDERIVIEFDAFYPPHERWHRVRCVPEVGGGILVFARDTTEERRSALAREETLSLLNAVIDGTTDMVAAIDRERHFLLANTAVAQFLGFDSPASILGKTDFELLTRDADRAMLQRIQAIDDAVMDSGEPRSFEFTTETTPTGGPRTYLYNKAPLRHPETGTVVGLVNVIHDITERERAERRLRRLFDSRVVGIIFWNLDTGLITDANDTFLTMVGYTRDDLAEGRLDFRRMTPPEWQERNEQGVESIRTEGATPTYEKEYFRKDGSRVPILIGGTRFDESSAEGFSFILDITERKQKEEEERARAERQRNRLTDIFMQAPAFMATLHGPRHVFEMANPIYHQLIGHREIIGKPVAEALPELRDQGFVEILNQVYRTGEPFVGENARLLLQIRPGEAMEERFVDFAYQPLHDDQGHVSGILVHGVDQTGRKRLEQEQERLLSEAQARAEREALIHQIGDGIRQSLAPEEIEARAVTALGQTLGADRCYIFTADTVRDLLIIARDFCGEGIPSITGQYSLSELGIDVDALFGSGKTLVVPHVQGGDRLSDQNAATNHGFQIASLINVPFYEGGRFVGALGVAMAHAARQWTPEEISLAEAVAGQLRSVLDAARLQRRERNIAHQLQEALQPTDPVDTEGLTLAKYYRAALGEAEVGGDFIDTFRLSANRVVLVVADLSGKGLNAASQVALVRNQLRYALYTVDLDTSGALSGVMQQLNKVLVTHELLSGFATLFVGVWDDSTRTLTYVNAGQEPGLVWKPSTGEVEMLLPTAPVLGGFIGGTFQQGTRVLAPGDVLALFTDGMTEVGRNRKELLEIEGIAGLFGWCCAVPDAPSIVLRLIAGVEAYAGGATGLRDDIALLVGVVQNINTPDGVESV